MFTYHYYLVGTLDRFNSGKLAEVNQRTKNDVSNISRLHTICADNSSIIENKMAV